MPKTKNILKVRKNLVRGENGYIIKSPKSEAGIRDIYLGEDVMEILNQARIQYMTDSLAYGKGFQNHGFVIRQEDGSPMRPDSMTRKWRRFLNTHDLPKIRLHDLRHSNATALIQAGVYGNARMGHYSTTKGALIAMTKALAKEVTESGVLVNCVSPGSVSPSDNEDIDFFKPSDLSFMGRTGTDRENANLILFLASDEASYISWQNIQIDGCRKKM